MTAADVAGRAAPSCRRLTSASLLERRLRRETQGEVLFDLASRGRYATDASIYQIMPVGVFVPRRRAGHLDCHRHRARPERSGARRAAPAPVSADRPSARPWSSTTASTCGACSTSTSPRAPRSCEPGLVLDELNAQLKPHGLWFPVDVSTSAQATLGGMAGNNSCGSRSIAYGNMVHNVLGVSAWLSDGALRRLRTGAHARRGRAAQIARVRARARGAASRRDRGALAQGAAPRGRLQPGYLRQPERTALHRRRQRQSRASAGRLGRHAGLHAEPDAAAVAAAALPGAWASSIFRLSAPRWRRRSTSSSWGRARSSWSIAS